MIETPGHPWPKGLQKIYSSAVTNGASPPPIHTHTINKDRPLIGLWSMEGHIDKAGPV
jgi:hypothetical protein